MRWLSFLKRKDCKAGSAETHGKPDSTKSQAMNLGPRTFSGGELPL